MDGDRDVVPVSLIASMTVSFGVPSRIMPSLPTSLTLFPSTTRRLFGTGSPPDPSINVPFLISSRVAFVMTIASLRAMRTARWRGVSRPLPRPSGAKALLPAATNGGTGAGPIHPALLWR